MSNQSLMAVAEVNSGKEEMSNRDRILQYCYDMRAIQRYPTRKILSTALEMKLSVVDYHVEKLIKDDKLRRLTNGVVELAEEPTKERAVSVTYVPYASVVIEIGDICVKVSLSEARKIGMLTIGICHAFRM